MTTSTTLDGANTRGATSLVFGALFSVAMTLVIGATSILGLTLGAVAVAILASAILWSGCDERAVAVGGGLAVVALAVSGCSDTTALAIADYGDWALRGVGAALSWLLGRYVWQRITHEKTVAILQRAYAEIGDAVREVEQTYVRAIREAAADGKLTAAERDIARDKAIQIAKSNLGKRGLERLGRMLGVDVDGWIGTKLEAAVDARKPAVAAIAAKLDTTGEPTDPARPIRLDPL